MLQSGHLDQRRQRNKPTVAFGRNAGATLAFAKVLRFTEDSQGNLTVANQQWRDNSITFGYERLIHHPLGNQTQLLPRNEIELQSQVHPSALLRNAFLVGVSGRKPQSLELPTGRKAMSWDSFTNRPLRRLSTAVALDHHSYKVQTEHGWPHR